MSRLRLDDVEWEKFMVGGNEGVFDVNNSKPYHKSSLTTSINGIPYVTRTSLNNGMDALIVDNNYEKNPKNTISLGAENADFFFQGMEYVAGNKMYCISNDNISKEVGLFLVQMFRQSIKECGFGYGKGLTGTRFKNRYIMLPVDSNGNPNWRFMEDYVKQEMKEQSQKVVKYYENKLLKLGFELLDLEVEWKEFFFTEIFKEIKRGKRLTKGNQIDGKTPYVSSTGLNNGVDNFIGNEDGVRKYKNNLSLANSGTVGSCFYHNYEYVASDHITALTSEYADEYIYIYI